MLARLFRSNVEFVLAARCWKWGIEMAEVEDTVPVRARVRVTGHRSGGENQQLHATLCPERGHV